jgi:transcriptional regulator with XRE-family HTH domain
MAANKRLEQQLNEFTGKRIRHLRQMHGLSQQVTGDAIGVTAQQVQKYENGNNRISATRLYLLADRLNTSIASFFPSAIDPERHRQISDQQARILRILHSIPEEYHGDVETMLRTFQKICSPYGCE